jgi:hypothetical protein
MTRSRITTMSAPVGLGLAGWVFLAFPGCAQDGSKSEGASEDFPAQMTIDLDPFGRIESAGAVLEYTEGMGGGSFQLSSQGPAYSDWSVRIGVGFDGMFDGGSFDIGAGKGSIEVDRTTTGGWSESDEIRHYMATSGRLDVGFLPDRGVEGVMDAVNLVGVAPHVAPVSASGSFRGRYDVLCCVPYGEVSGSPGTQYACGTAMETAFCEGVYKFHDQLGQ